MKTSRCTIILLLALSSQAQGALYFVTDLGASPNSLTAATSINNSGMIAGWTETYDGIGQALVWQPGQPPISLGVTGPFESSFALQINDSGTVLGQFVSSRPDYTTQSFIWSAKGELQPIGDSTLQLTSLNNAGQAVGFALSPGTASSIGVTYDPFQGIQKITVSGQIGTEAQKINNQAQILLRETFDTGNAAVILQPGGEITPIIGITQSEFNLSDMNDMGSVVGAMLAPSGDWLHAFIWDSVHGMKDITPGIGIASYPTAINNQGEVVGWAYDATRMHSFAFFYDGSQVYDITTLLEASGANFGYFSLDDINDSGQIVGSATYSDGLVHAVLLTPSNAPSGLAPVPEPSTAATLGLAGMLLLRRRRRNA